MFEETIDYIINKIIQNIRESENRSLDIEKLKEKLIIFKKYYHKEKKLDHWLRVGLTLVELKIDHNAVIAALLQDIEEDRLKIWEVQELFGNDVGNLVSGIRDLSELFLKPKNIKQAENFKKLIFTFSEDTRILIIKLCDILESIRIINNFDKDVRIKLAFESLEIYAPLAGRLGLQQIKAELQDVSFAILYGKRKKYIDYKIKHTIKNDSVVDEVVETLKSIFKISNLNAEIYGRKKSAYSIWMKMQQKNVSFEQLSDVVAFRIIVDSQMDCYKGLGILHSNYKVIPGSFQDFISVPKQNEYQSIHTTVIGPLQYKIEIQIRTKMMHNIAESGCAAHWIYKEFQRKPENQYEWISDLLNIADQHSDPEEFLHNTKLAIYYDQIFCFTPKGRVVSLPKYATILDFAYSLNPSIGNRSTGAIINGVKFENNHLLNSGDQVTIITSLKQQPSLEWIDFVITGKARSSIKHYILNQSKKKKKPEKSRITPTLNSENIKCENFNNITHALEEPESQYVHKNLQDSEYKEIIHLSHINKDNFFTSKIRCVLRNEIDILANLVKIVVNNHYGLLDIKSGDQANNLFEFFLYVQSDQTNQIDLLLDYLKNINGVELVSRIY
jgi:GTP pyrophosphokinase